MMPTQPNTTAAVQQQDTANMRAMVQAANRLLQQAGIKGSPLPVLAGDAKTTRPDVMIHAHAQVHPRVLDYIAAWHGMLNGTPRVIAFNSHASGADRLHVLHSAEPPAAIADTLRAAGVPKFSIHSGTAYVFDPGGSLDLTPVARSLRASSYHAVNGTGRIVGSGEGADASTSRAAYRAAIDAAERSVGSGGSGSGAGASQVGDSAVVKMSRVNAQSAWVSPGGEWHPVPIGKTHGSELSRHGFKSHNDAFAGGWVRVYHIGDTVYGHNPFGLTEGAKTALVDHGIGSGFSRVEHDDEDRGRILWTDHEQLSRMTTTKDEIPMIKGYIKAPKKGVAPLAALADAMIARDPSNPVGKWFAHVVTHPELRVRHLQWGSRKKASVRAYLSVELPDDAGAHPDTPSRLMHRIVIDHGTHSLYLTAPVESREAAHEMLADMPAGGDTVDTEWLHDVIRRQFGGEKPDAKLGRLPPTNRVLKAKVSPALLDALKTAASTHTGAFNPVSPEIVHRLATEIPHVGDWLTRNGPLSMPAHHWTGGGPEHPAWPTAKRMAMDKFGRQGFRGNDLQRLLQGFADEHQWVKPPGLTHEDTTSLSVHLHDGTDWHTIMLHKPWGVGRNAPTEPGGTLHAAAMGLVKKARLSRARDELIRRAFPHDPEHQRY